MFMVALVCIMMYNKNIAKEGKQMNYITIKELASMLGVTRATIYSYMKQGLPSYKLGRSRKFDESEVREWVQERKEV